MHRFEKTLSPLYKHLNFGVDRDNL